MNDHLVSGDSGSVSILLLPDLSSALDTVFHELLISRLLDLGISGAPHSCFSSHLSDRQFYNLLKDFRSPTVPLKQGVPQGSVWPLLF